MYCLRIVIGIFLEVRKNSSYAHKKGSCSSQRLLYQIFIEQLRFEGDGCIPQRAIKQVHNNFLSGEILLTLQLVIHNRSYPPELRGVQSSWNHHSFSTWKWCTLALKIANDINISLLVLDDWNTYFSFPYFLWRKNVGREALIHWGSSLTSSSLGT